MPLPNQLENIKNLRGKSFAFEQAANNSDIIVTYHIHSINSMPGLAASELVYSA